MEEYTFRGILAVEEMHWWYVARRQLIVDHVTGDRILEIGSGTGNILVALAKKCGEIIGIDLSLAAANLSRDRTKQAILHNVEIVLADGLKLCFPKESFDMVICADIIEHIQDECTFLNEVRNVLKPGGYLLITAPASKRLWSRMDEELGHHRRYDLSGMRSLLWESRFRDIRIRYWNSIPFPLMLLYRRLLNPGFARELKVGNRFNSILYRLLKLEELVNLPFGASLFAVARRT